MSAPISPRREPTRNPEEPNEYARVITAIARLPMETPTPSLVLEGEALDVWRTGHDRVELEQTEGERLSGIRDWACKHAGRVARIAGLLHLVEHRGPQAFKTPISPETVVRAWTIGDYLTEHALVALGSISATPGQRLAQRILGWIRRHEPEAFSLRDLHQHHRNVDSPADLLPGLRVLETRNFIRREPEPEKKGPGRNPSPTFRVNPLTYAHNSQNPQNPAQRELCEFRDEADQ